jgi:hypothetical protein
MIRVKLKDLYRHRNETTFRPYLMAKNLFEDIGVKFVTEGACDLTWVAQASYNDKKNSYTYGNCLSRGLHYLNTEVSGDYVLFDGQDSASLVGSFDVLKNSRAKLLLKNTLYNTFEDYLTPWKMGRMYWGEGVPLLNPNEKPEETFGYSLMESDRDLYSKVVLTGCNWLSTTQPRWYDYNKLNKDIDVFAMFAYPCKENWEFGCLTSKDYDEHREKCVKMLEYLPDGIKIVKVENGVKVPIEQYYYMMSRSKIVIAPFGYGEIAPRDIEAAQFGAVLIKPNMSHIQSIPNIYSENTYLSCNWDYSDLESLVSFVLDDFDACQEGYVNSMRTAFKSQYNLEKLVLHTYDWLTKLDGFETE